MSLTNPPVVVTKIADALAACAVWTSFGLSAAAIWYPEADDSATLPRATITRGEHIAPSFAEGVQGIPSGSVEVFVETAETKTDGELEVFAETLCQQLTALGSGIIIRSATISPALQEEAGSEANDGTKCIVITINYGLEV